MPANIVPLGEDIALERRNEGIKEGYP